MKKFLTFALALAFLSPVIWAKPEKLTSTITWEITPDGTLRISGRGEMPDFDYNKKKCWLQKKYEGKVRRIAIGEGITKIGDYNFKSMDIYDGNSMRDIEEVSIPSSVRIIGFSAFCRNGMAKVNFSEGLFEIKKCAFEDCKGLTELKLPQTLQTIYPNAFVGCTNIRTIDFSGSQVALCVDAFKKDSGITEIKNGENVYFGKVMNGVSSSLQNVFSETHVTEEMLRGKPQEAGINTAAAEAGGETEPLPNLLYVTDYEEGGEVYGGTSLELNLAGPDKRSRLDNVSTPWGYYQYVGEGGDGNIFIFDDVKRVGNHATFKAVRYMYEYDSDAGREILERTDDTEDWSADYNCATGELKLKVPGYEETFGKESLVKDEVAPGVFKATYIGNIYDVDWELVGGRSIDFEKVGDKVLMVVGEIYNNGRIYGNYYALGHIEGRRIVFYKGIYDQGGFAGAEAAYVANDYKKLIELMQKEESEVECRPGLIIYNGETYHEVNP